MIFSWITCGAAGLTGLCHLVPVSLMKGALMEIYLGLCQSFTKQVCYGSSDKCMLLDSHCCRHVRWTDCILSNLVKHEQMELYYESLSPKVVVLDHVGIFIPWPSLVGYTEMGCDVYQMSAELVLFMFCTFNVPWKQVQMRIGLFSVHNL